MCADRKRDLEGDLALLLIDARVPSWRAQYRFAGEHVGRGRGVKARLKAAGLKNWRFDFAWPERKLAVEVEGGHWMQGRHVRGQGFENDCEKYNEAALLGWRVLRVTSTHIDDWRAVVWIKRALEDAP